MTDQEKIIEDMARAYRAAYTRQCDPDQVEPCASLGDCACEKLGMAAAFAICAPAVRERCAEVADAEVRKYEAVNDLARCLVADDIRKATRALPLDGLTGGKGESEAQRWCREWTEKQAAYTASVPLGSPSAPAPVQAGMGEVLQKFVAHYPMGINPFLDEAYREARSALAAASAKGERP